MAHGQTRRTRIQTEHPLFGSPSDLPPLQLPTLGDALRLIWRNKCEEEQDGDFKLADKNKAIKLAVDDISLLWEKAIGDRKTVPLISQKAIEGRLKRSYEKGVALVRNKNKKDIPQFKESLSKLFDICSCTCSSISCLDIKCKLKKCDGYHLSCKCEIKVPQREIKFLLDQRLDRKMKMVGVDKVVTELWSRSEDRENDEMNRAEKFRQSSEKDKINHIEA